MLQRDDESYMRLALKEASKAYEAGEVPVGAIVVHDNQIVAKAHNQVEMLKDATAHAEILAITQASVKLDAWRLSDATLYVTKEPCAMCAGAMVNAKLTNVVFGVADPRMGAAGSALDVTGFDGMLHNVNVKSGILQEECLHILQQFFQEQRKKQKDND